METTQAARDPWIEPAKPTGDKLAQIRKCRRSQDEGVITKPDPDSADVDFSQREHLNPIEWGKPAPLRPVPHRSQPTTL